MKISNINLLDFKRFTNLTIRNIPISTKVVVIVGPNGSGKSSLFDAFLFWYKNRYKPVSPILDYYEKKGSDKGGQFERVSINFYDYVYTHPDNLKGKFYFRTAYRHDADFTMGSLNKQNDPTESHRIVTLMQNDATVQQNYQSLVSLTLQGVYDEKNNERTVRDLRGDIIGRVRNSLSNVFEDLNLSSIGDPLRNGSFYFEKGVSKDFHYRNLSGGEKAAFDLILDMIVKSSYFDDTIFCIDEPEIHLHTKMQSRLFDELYNLVPSKSQLWINTHSLGMLKKARELSKINLNAIVFLDFHNINFDKEVIIEPAEIDRTIWEKFIELTMDDLTTLLSPKNVVFCEGNPLGRAYKDFDAQIYNKIFAKKYSDTTFISLGSCNDLIKDDNTAFRVIQNVLKGSIIYKVIDRDARSLTEITELNNRGIKVLRRRNIESYLLDNEIIEKLCTTTGNSDKLNAALQVKQNAIDESVIMGNFADDVKSASGKIFVELKKLLGILQGGNTKDAFFRDTIADLITEETNIFKELEREIF